MQLDGRKLRLACNAVACNAVGAWLTAQRHMYPLIGEHGRRREPFARQSCSPGTRPGRTCRRLHVPWHPGRRGHDTSVRLLAACGPAPLAEARGSVQTGLDELVSPQTFGAFPAASHSPPLQAPRPWRQGPAPPCTEPLVHLVSQAPTCTHELSVRRSVDRLESATYAAGIAARLRDLVAWPQRRRPESGSSAPDP
ncbi:hypothetical protein BDY21DRAFT_113984 [Lineolata rhizophorae]|uniref:Uncharacterized protein n=1 Tax=Lineolata rhizophorae TaxID=578093 RepID=A0A6A6NQ38_9PEZI|nr:hypothetical protein BDY21DRAFT_113984 [Lineolata rhizophorae]